MISAEKILSFIKYDEKLHVNYLRRWCHGVTYDIGAINQNQTRKACDISRYIL